MSIPDRKGTDPEQSIAFFQRIGATRNSPDGNGGYVESRSRLIVDCWRSLTMVAIVSAHRSHVA